MTDQRIYFNDFKWIKIVHINITGTSSMRCSVIFSV